jgi:hypothetical protein
MKKIPPDSFVNTQVDLNNISFFFFFFFFEIGETKFKFLRVTVHFKEGFSLFIVLICFKGDTLFGHNLVFS